LKRLIAAAPLLVAWSCSPNSATDSSTNTSAVKDNLPSSSTPGLPDTGGSPTQSISPNTGPVPGLGVETHAPSEESYLPMADGNDWIYEAEVSNGSNGSQRDRETVEIIFKMIDVKRVDGKTQAALAVYQGDILLDKSVFQQGPAGIYQTASGAASQKFTIPEPVMTFPLQPAEEFHWANSGQMPNAKPGSQTGKTVVSKAGQIDTAVSTVSGIASTTSSTFTSKDGGGQAVTTTWFQLGVGIVRMVQTITENNHTNTMTLRLKSWTLQN
jgi:hypothetical protein